MARFVSRSRAVRIILSAAAISACMPEGPVVPPAQVATGERGIELHLIGPGQTLPFAPLPTSAPCVLGGTFQQVVLPTGFAPTLVAVEGPGYLDLADMLTVNETGPHKGRFLYRTHETGTNGGVSVTDLETGITRVLAQRADFERFDGIAWTPWGTVIAAEEAIVAALGDPTVPQATGGLVYEFDANTGTAAARPAVGSRSHEGLRFDEKGNLYGISETTPGYIYKFVPDKKGDLRTGQLYALKIITDFGDRTGIGEWVALDRTAVQINSVAEATAKGATGWSRPEDIEIGTSTGTDRRGNDILYVAVTSEDRVLAIDLDPKNQPAGRVLVSDYVRDGVNAPANFDAPDNLALDLAGNLFISEDPGGTAAGGKTLGDNVWFAPFNPSSATQSLPIQRFLSITDCDAEPTGLYLSPSGKTLFLNIQHRGGADPRDHTIAVWRSGEINYSIVK